MKAIEFNGKPYNGNIQIPEEYRDKITGTVRVIVLVQEQNSGKVDAIDRLLEKPLHVENFKPLTSSEIYERS